MPNPKESACIPNDPFQALLLNTMALELSKPDSAESDKPLYKKMQDTSCYYHCGRFLRHKGNKESDTVFIHLAHTGPYAVLIDATTDDIVHSCHLFYDLLMVAEAKQAFIFQVPNSLVLLKLDDMTMFQQVKESIPGSWLHPAIELYNKYYSKENTGHVHN